MCVINHNDMWFFVTKDTREIHFRITAENNFQADSLWECRISALWKNDYMRETPELMHVWERHTEGDFFQETLMRHNKELHPGTSYTATFHDMLRANIDEFPEIINLYSTSKLPELSLEYRLYPQAENFWNIQVQNELAEFIEEEQRFRAVLR